MSNKTGKTPADIVTISKAEEHDIPRDICLRILFVQEKQKRLDAEMRATALETELLKREALDAIGVDGTKVNCNINPETGKAVVQERAPAN